MKLSSAQHAIVESSPARKLFLSGPAGTGKTTAAINRINFLVENGIEARKILLFFPQRNLGARYQKSIGSTGFPARSLPVFATYGGLARRMIELFWPAVLEKNAGFSIQKKPTFLTLESSLYFLARIVDPLIEQEGYFSTVTIQRNRLYSQILDNLNKSAVHGFPHTDFSRRLISAWIGDSSQELIYQQAQAAANKFREFCYQENLFDFSLQIELFSSMLNDMPLIKNHLGMQFDHLVYDNLEEDIPVAHDLIRKLLPDLKSCLLIFDEDAGYRSFLGASPDSGKKLSDLLPEKVRLENSFTSSPALTDFNSALIHGIDARISENSSRELSSEVFSINYLPHYPELAAWIADEILNLIERGADPGNIAVLAPYLSDSLRFLLSREFDQRKLPYTSHRPSRALREEPITQCLLTLAAVAHPAWEIYPSVYELAVSFLQAFNNLDLTRAYLLAKNALRTPSAADNPLRLAAFEDFDTGVQSRITYTIGSQYQQLLTWLANYAGSSALYLDQFLSRLFGELLTRPELGFYDNLSKGRITAQIIESFTKFRQTAADVLHLTPEETGREYYLMVKYGVLANQYLRSWTEVPPGKVLLAPAYTFLLNNNPVDYQFWLDIGSRGWYERINQPLTNPHVLHRNWPPGKRWTDIEETELNSETLKCLTTGLIRRCRRRIFGCLTEADERGQEQKGLLIQSLNRLHIHDPEISDQNEAAGHG